MRDPFHDAFLAALAGDFAALEPWCAPTAAGLSVYRNTAIKGCADALVAQFPSLVRVVGEAWLTEAGAVFAQAQPPRRASLLTYGDAFPEWLAQFPPASDMPFLPRLAEMDLLWAAAYGAADAVPLDPSALADLDEAALGLCRLGLHPATRFALFEDSTPSLWSALQPPADPPTAFELFDEAEGLLLLRPGPDVRHRLTGPGEVAFLAACRDGVSLTEAGAAALGAEPRLDLASAFASLLADGAFSSLRTPS